MICLYGYIIHVKSAKGPQIVVFCMLGQNIGYSHPNGADRQLINGDMSFDFWGRVTEILYSLNVFYGVSMMW